MEREYVHQELGQEINALAGFYVPMKELKLSYDSREVLCVIGMSKVESACCGGGSCSYAQVPGYILRWKDREKDGLAVSQVEPIEDEDVKKEIAGIVRNTECVGNIEFW